MSDRTRSPIGKRSPFLLVGGLGAALCISSLALEPPFWLMVAAITLAGMFLYVAVGPYNSLLADIAPFEQRGRLGGLIAFAGVVGALAFTLISVLFWDTARGWVFILTGAGVLVSLWIVAVGVHEPPSTAMHLPQAHERATRLWQEVLRDHRLALYIASMGTYWVAAGAASPFITRFGVIELHVSESNSFLLLLPLVIASAVGAVVAGYLADRFERKQILHYSLILFSAAVIAASLVRDLAQAIPVMVVVGLCNGSLTALQVPLLADMVPRARAGAFMGFASMIWSLAQPVGSVIAGLLVDISGSYRGVFFFSGVVMFISMLILRRVKSSRADT